VERFTLVVTALVFLLAVVAVIVVTVGWALGTPIARNPLTLPASVFLAISSVLHLVTRGAVRRAHRRERRDGFTTVGDRFLDREQRDPVSGALQRRVGEAPDVDHAWSESAPLPQETIAVPYGPIARFEPVMRWDIAVFVVLLLALTPPILWFRWSTRPTPIDWSVLGPAFVVIGVIAAGIAVVVLVVRRTARRMREAATRRRLLTAVVFTARRTDALVEALGILGVSAPRQDVQIALDGVQLEVRDLSRSLFATPWRDLAHVRPGRVSRGRWPIPRSSRAIIARARTGTGVVDVPLTPVAAPPFGRVHANAMLDEFRTRVRVVSNAD
jgi:hypothetical protein